MPALERLTRIDRRWIFLAVGVILIVFLLLDIQMAPPKSPQGRGFFRAIESLEPGDRVWLALDYDPSSQAEILPIHRAVVHHLFARDVKVIAAALWPLGPAMGDRVFREVAPAHGKEEGRDYVNLGFKDGGEIVLQGLGASVTKIFEKDKRGIPVEKLEAMRGIETIKDVALVVNISAGAPGTRQWLQQVQTRYDVRLVAGVTAVMAPDLYAFHQSGQIEGFLGGLAGAAEYEGLLDALEVDGERAVKGEEHGLVGRIDSASKGMNVQSFMHIFVVLLIVAGNVFFVLERYLRRRRS